MWKNTLDHDNLFRQDKWFITAQKRSFRQLFDRSFYVLTNRINCSILVAIKSIFSSFRASVGFLDNLLHFYSLIFCHNLLSLCLGFRS